MRTLTLVVGSICVLCAAGLALGGTAPAPVYAQQCPSVMAALRSASYFTTSVVAAQNAGVAPTLASGSGPFTVFAPTDSAFRKLPGWEVNYVLHNPGKDAQIVKYHIVPGAALSLERLKVTQSLPTWNGMQLVVDTDGGTIVLNGRARVIGQGVTCANGVVYPIDTVLLP